MEKNISTPLRVLVQILVLFSFTNMQPALWRDLASSVLQKVLINSEKCLHFQQNTISVQLRQKFQQVQFLREENYLNLIMPILGMIISRSEAFHKKQTNFTKHIQRAWDSRRWHSRHIVNGTSHKYEW